MMGIIAPPVFIPTLQLSYEKRGTFEKPNPTHSLIIPSTSPYPSRNEIKTIIIASNSENPISLKALVMTKYAIYRANNGRRI